MEIIIKKDWEWYFAEVKWKSNIYAFWYSQESAIEELKNVVDMMVDYHNEKSKENKSIMKNLIKKNYTYAV